MEDEQIITLDKPVKIGDMEYHSLTLREPTAGEIERATAKDERGISVTINLISMVAAVPRKVVENLPQRKFQKAAEIIESFTDTSETTGKTS